MAVMDFLERRKGLTSTLVQKTLGRMETKEAGEMFGIWTCFESQARVDHILLVEDDREVTDDWKDGKCHQLKWQISGGSAFQGDSRNTILAMLSQMFQRIQVQRMSAQLDGIWSAGQASGWRDTQTAASSMWAKVELRV